VAQVRLARGGGGGRRAADGWALWAGSTLPLVSWGLRLPWWRSPLLLSYYFGGFALGLASLALNAASGSTAVRRKSRVIVWGTLVGFGPALLLFAAARYARRPPYEFPFWLWASCALNLAVMPVSFAYAVVKHRVLELPVLLRRSARYLLVQRGSAGLLLLLGVAAAGFFSVAFGRALGPGRQAAAAGLGVGFGTVLVWTGTELHRRVRAQIDRAFFRSAYDARQILEELARRARIVASRRELADLLFTGTQQEDDETLVLARVR